MIIFLLSALVLNQSIYSQDKKWSQFELLEQGQKCFSVYRVLPDIFAIEEKSQFEVIISYLIIGSEKALLFDSGLGTGNIKEIVVQLTDKEVIILNSHTHYDHIGGNHLFDAIYCCDTPFTHKNAKGMSHKEFIKFYHRSHMTSKPFPLAGYCIKPFQITHYIKEGEKINLGNRLLEVIKTPGHSKDDICLLDRANKLLFTGDTFYEGPLFAHLLESDFNTYLASMKKLCQLKNKIDKLLPAHSPPFASSDYLQKVAQGFIDIKNKKVQKTRNIGKYCLYRFEGFAILVRDTLH